MKPYTITQGETLRVEVEYKDAAGDLVDLSTASTYVVIAFKSGTNRFNGVTSLGYATTTIDRTVTDIWRPGEYKMQVWVEWPEGFDVEAEMVYCRTIKVEAGIRVNV